MSPIARPTRSPYVNRVALACIARRPLARAQGAQVSTLALADGAQALLQRPRSYCAAQNSCGMPRTGRRRGSRPASSSGAPADTCERFCAVRSCAWHPGGGSMSRRHRKFRLSRQTGGFPPGDAPALPALRAPLSHRCARRFETLVLIRVDAAECMRMSAEVVLPGPSEERPGHGQRTRVGRREIDGTAWNVMSSFDGDGAPDILGYDPGSDLDSIGSSPMPETRTVLMCMPCVAWRASGFAGDHLRIDAELPSSPPASFAAPFLTPTWIDSPRARHTRRCSARSLHAR